MMEQYSGYIVPFIMGVVVPAILNRLGIKVPVIVPDPIHPATPSPKPVVAPVVAPEVSAQLAAAVEWVIRARAGLVAVSEADRKALTTLDALVHEILA